MSTGFLRISPYCLLPIFQDWLSVFSCVDLNTSCCNHKDRDKLAHVLTVSRKVDCCQSSETTKYFISLLIDCPFRIASTNLKCIKLRQLSSETDLHYVIDYLQNSLLIYKRLNGITCIDLEASLSQISSPTSSQTNDNSFCACFTFWVRNSGEQNNRSHVLYKNNFFQTPVISSVSILNGKFNGRGLQFFGYVEYCGSFLNGKRHGIGLLIKDKSKYEGNFENDQYSGQGKLS